MIFQLIVSVLLIIIVLIQFGKGAEAGLMASVDSSMTGSQQGNVLNKITIVLAVLFLGNSILLARIQGHQATSKFYGEAPVVAPLNSDAIQEELEKTQAPEAQEKSEEKTEAKKDDSATK